MGLINKVFRGMPARVLEILEGFVNRTFSLDVKIQDQTTEIIDLHLTQLIQAVTIVTDTSIDDITVTVSAGVQPTVGSVACFKEGTRFYQGEILTSVANGDNWDIGLDTPLDYPYTTLGGCSERSESLNVNGSVTPQIFSVSPSGLGTTQWDITRIMFTITDDAAMDDSKFGGITKLTKGIIVRVIDGYTKNIFNAKSNEDMSAHMYDVIYSDKAPAGFYGFRARRTFAGQEKNGVTIRLDASTSDELQIIIQDNLTELTTFKAIAQGHVVEDG